MTVYYNRTKTMKSARIGTIMAWGGDGNEGFLQSNIPRGWILCDGKTYSASRYPLLASMVGDTYGGTSFSGTFPDYTGTFKVPDMTAKCPMDLEPYMLTDSKYQYGQSDAASIIGTKVLDYGSTTPIPTLISADSDIDFTINSTLNFVGKMTNITITNPDFNTTIYTYNRKLGINHMPGHNHPGTYSKTGVDSVGPMVFESSRVNTSGSITAGDSGCTVSGSFTQCAAAEETKIPQWIQGAASITFYGDDSRENTLVTTDKFNEFVNSATKNWNQVPASIWPSTLSSDFLANTQTDGFNAEPVKTHAEPAWSGLFPRPSLNFNKRNYFGYTPSNAPVGVTGLPDDPESVASFTVSGVSLIASATKISLPAGTDIGAEFNKIVPFMLISGNYIPDGTQILSIARISGTSTANYVYEIELSNSSTNTTTQNISVTMRQGTFPTTQNNLPAGQDPNSSTFTGHNHGSFEIAMSVGSLAAAATFPVTNVSLGDVAPENIPDALNIIADITAPSLNVTYLIKAY